MTEEEKYWVGFSVFPGVGPVRFQLLTNYFGSAKAAWHATRTVLQEIRVPPRLVDAFIRFRDSFSIDSYVRDMERMHIVALPGTHSHYPKLLKEISDAPFVLYIKGKPAPTPINMERTIAVVGTRRATPYGITATQTIVRDLVEEGCTIVSGMAYGIDAVAHETAIACHGKTIAVLGCGVDICAPAANRHIYDACSVGGYGAVVSEMPLGLRPDKGLFPARNRIVSGLSRAVLVVEGAGDSGSLITARNAAEQGRDVFAVPGPITSPMSKGPAILLKEGAQLTESANDILVGLGLAKLSVSGNNKKTNVSLTDHEEIIFDLVSQEPTHIDALISKSGLTASIVTATITVLELKGYVKDIGGKTYATHHC